MEDPPVKIQHCLAEMFARVSFIFEISKSVLQVLKVLCKKKLSKLGRKFYFTKSCSIWFELRHFLDKVYGKNMLKFSLNKTTFY